MGGMKKRNKAWLALAGLVLLVGVALADFNVRDHGTHFQNASTGLRTNSTGDLRVETVNGPETFAVFEPGWLNTVLRHRLANGAPPSPAVMQDSTTAVDVSGCTGLALFIHPTFRDSTSAQVLALQVRWHYSTVVDSTSTFIEQATKTFDASASATVRDSIGSLLFGDAASPYQVGKYGEEADSLATPDEQVLVLTNSVGQNRGRMVRIQIPGSETGGSAGPYMSIRLRHLNSQYLTGAWMGNATSGAGGIQGEQAVNVRVDLVGWR